MQKREFIKTLALAGISLPLSGKNTDEIMYKFQNYSASQMANDEDFWLNLRNAYKLKTDYINLENVYYSMMPQPILNEYIAEIKMLNFHALATLSDRPMLYLDIINELPVVKNNEFKKLFSCYLLRKFSLYESDNNSVFKQSKSDSCSHVNCRRIDEELVSKYPKIFTIHDPCSSDGYI